MALAIFSLCLFTHSNLLSHFVNNIIPQLCKHFNRFAGWNLSTDPKCPKCIYKISKNFRVKNRANSLIPFARSATSLGEAHIIFRRQTSFKKTHLCLGRQKCVFCCKRTTKRCVKWGKND